MATDGWRPLQRPRPGAEAFEVTPFARLARSHAVAVAGDTLVAIALAGTLFFSIDVGQARSEVFLYLALTMAPFAVVAPLVGPALDRAAGGRRWMIIGASAGRALVCLLMVREVDSLLLFPLAFVLLVLAKSHQVAKSALVPTTVRSHEGLVEANSKLSLLSGVIGFAAAVPGGLLLRFGGSEWVLALAAVVFAVGVGVSWRLPRVQVAPEPESDEGKAELRGAGVLLAASAMGLLRGVVGFATFLLAFSLRTDGSPTWHFGVVLAASGAGGLAGAALAPVLRRTVVEERILTGLLVVVGVIGVVSAWLGGVVGATVLGFVVALGAAGAKQAFDSIVQRDAPDANRGRSFARFETRFQLIWVAGAVLGIIPMPMWVGFLLVAATAAFAAVSYTAGSRSTRLLAERRRRRRARADAPDDGPRHRALPPTIVAPGGEPPPPPPPPPPAPPLVPPSIATPGDLPGDPTRVEDGP
ncbi:MAG: MFS transporter [Acidimicrobiia bacterium]